MSAIDNNAMSGSENNPCARVLQDDELDVLSGGFRFEMGGLPCVRFVALENALVNN